jgi:hypothetical protein
VGDFLLTQVNSGYACNELDITISSFYSGPFTATGSVNSGSQSNTVSITESGSYYMQFPGFLTNNLITIQIAAPDSGSMTIGSIQTTTCPVASPTATTNPSFTPTNTPVPVTGTPTPIPTFTPLPSGHNTFTATRTPAANTQTPTPAATSTPTAANGATIAAATATALAVATVCPAARSVLYGAIPNAGFACGVVWNGSTQSQAPSPPPVRWSYQQGVGSGSAYLFTVPGFGQHNAGGVITGQTTNDLLIMDPGGDYAAGPLGFQGSVTGYFVAPGTSGVAYAATLQAGLLQSAAYNGSDASDSLNGWDYTAYPAVPAIEATAIPLAPFRLNCSVSGGPLPHCNAGAMQTIHATLIGGHFYSMYSEAFNTYSQLYISSFTYDAGTPGPSSTPTVTSTLTETPTGVPGTATATPTTTSTPPDIPGAISTAVATDTPCPNGCAVAKLTGVPAAIKTALPIDTSPFTPLENLSLARSSCAPFFNAFVPIPVVHGTPVYGSTTPFDVTWVVPVSGTTDLSGTSPISGTGNAVFQPCAQKGIPTWVWDLTYWGSVLFTFVAFTLWIVSVVARLSGNNDTQ